MALVNPGLEIKYISLETASEVFEAGDEILTHVRPSKFRITELGEAGASFIRLNGKQSRGTLAYDRVNLVIDRFHELSSKMPGGNKVTTHVRDVTGDTSNESQYWAFVCEFVRRSQELVDVEMAPELHRLEGEPRQAMVRHLRRERCLRQAKLRAAESLSCEACGFNFAAAYGAIGKGFAHVHHERQLRDYSGAEVTRLSDLRIVCANCHAMIHSRKTARTMREVMKSLRTARKRANPT